MDGCSNKSTARGLCAKHYERWKKHGDPGIVLKRARKVVNRLCTIEGCGAKHSGRGYCATHLARLNRFGTPTPEGIKFPSKRGEYLSDGITKVCSTCLIDKPVAEFGKQSVRADGLDIKCKQCHREKNQMRYADPEKRKRIQESGARWRERNPDNDANKTLKRKYGITLEEYDRLFTAQGGVCALCKKPESVRRRKRDEGRERLAVDHCHDTGRVRGLLCFKCNTAIGALGDTEESAQRVVEYLAKQTPLT